MLGRNDTLIADIRNRLAASEPVRRVLESISSKRIEVVSQSIEARALYLATLQERTGKRIAVVVPADASLEEFTLALRLFHRNPECVATYPAPSLSPYQELPPSLAVTRDEIRALGLLVSKAANVMVIPSRALYRLLPRPEDFATRIIRFAENEDINVQATLQRFVDNGFTRTDLVGETGEFAFRGGILDVFPPNSDQPIRIELFGDTVESIRHFEVESQRSLDTIGSFSIEPATQFPIDPAVRRALAKRMSLDFNDPIYKRDVAEKIERIQEHGSFPGIESFVPVASAHVAFADYLRDDDWMLAVVEPDEVTSAIERYETLLRTEYDNTVAKGKAVYAPDRLLASAASIHEFLATSRVDLTSVHIARVGDVQANVAGHSDVRQAEVAGHSDVRHAEDQNLRPLEELRLGALPRDRYINRLGELPGDLTAGHNAGRKQVIFVATKGGREKVERLFGEFSIPFASDPKALSDEIAVTHGNIAQGFELDAIGLSVLSEWDLFEPPTSTRVGRRKKATETFLTDLRDLKVGDYVVHVDHGIGRFRGLQRLAFGDTEREVMQLEYANAGKLLLPMESLNLIQKYSGGEDTQPRLDKLGGVSWARTKASVKKAMRDMADELLKLYATRQMIAGHAFSKDSPWQFEFEEAFEFDETEDQENAIDDVKHDMESRRPMDRLLCGDVGYGKTEVAMRAAFKSAMDGKQVAVLAPTTILAFQHYQTFRRRFASFPVTVELLSRYWSAKDQKEIKKKIESGEIDIVIGTHRILSKDIVFKDLGVVVIDEEQRFGVAQKERLKQYKKAVDVLSMSATPIPRTLHMSMVGIRDISVIETPPKDRLAIQTNVVPFDDNFIAEAIEFELGRGGQVFFVHNRVESIHAMKDYLEKIVPGLRVIVGHGQMDERELEKAMLAFIERKFDVLLATTIIENGIDIPACNTILINHAERFGLSQLYQLRGRVGRSDRLAFCYLLVPSDRVLSSDARKRLAAIQEFSDLGAGFRIAAKDLEIRGAGNILGGEQSGQIAAVGFEMYAKLLEETVRELKGEKIEEEVETSMNIGVDIYIPHDYIADENLRIGFYKKIASAKDARRLEEIRNELRDRFGALPYNVENLLEFVRLKQYASTIGVVSIVREGYTVAVKFHPSAKIDPNRLFQLLQEMPEAKFTPTGALSLPIRAGGKELIDRLERLLSDIAIAA